MKRPQHLETNSNLFLSDLAVAIDHCTAFNLEHRAGRVTKPTSQHPLLNGYFELDILEPRDVVVERSLSQRPGSGGDTGGMLLSEESLVPRKKE